MSEYIFKSRCTDDFELDERDKTNPVDWYGTLHGEIVRCRDCAYFDTRKCKSQWPFCLDAFCWWGKRKEGGE